MRAIVITAGEKKGKVALEEVDSPPPPTANQVSVRVRAAGLNRADLLQRDGKYPAPPGFPQHIPGLEFAGEIDSVGELVSTWKVGDKVCGITGGGAQAEILVTPESLLARMPPELSWIEGAALPEAFITAHDALVVRAKLQLGERVLIHAAASGVGTAAVQLAHAAGAFVFGTSRTSEKLERLAPLGMDQALAVEDHPMKMAERVQELTNGAGVDVILDLVGGAYLSANLIAIAPGGRIICVGTTGGTKAEIDLGTVLRKRISIIGTVLRARSVAEKAEATRRFATEVLPLVKSKRIRPMIDCSFPAREAAAAYNHLESNRTLGKVVLEFAT